MAIYDYDLSRLWFNDSGTWRQVETPYVNDGGTWKTVHNVWLKVGGNWKLCHKTKHSADTYSTISGGTFTSNGSYTVPEGVRYINIEVHGGGGSAGGGDRSGGEGNPGGHWPGCPTHLTGSGHFQLSLVFHYLLLSPE